MVEQRDPYTAGHAEGVSRLAVAIGQQMGMDEDTIEGLRVCGLLHDAGKISVPAEILTKPTRLTDLEFAMVKLHSRTGYEILKKITSDMKIIVLTGYGEREEVVEALRLGVSDFINKPIELKVIEDAVEKASFRRLKEEKLTPLSKRI